MVDIVEDTLPFLEIEKILGRSEEILPNHDALTGIDVDTKLLIDFVTTNASKIVFLGIKEETFQKSAGIGSRWWITRAQLAIDILEGRLFVECRILLEGLNENLVFAGINDLHSLLTEGNELANHSDGEGFVGAGHNKLTVLDILERHEGSKGLFVHLVADLELLNIVEVRNQITLGRISESAKESRCEELTAATTTVEVDVGEIVRVELNLKPRSAVGNNTEGMKNFSVEVNRLLKADTRGTVEL